jgi:hypothetical protein
MAANPVRQLRNPRSTELDTTRGVRSYTSNVQAPFAIAERYVQGFPIPESALTVMAMTSGAAVASADLDPLYDDLGEMEAGVR